MEQFVVVPFSEYNKSVTTQTVTKQEFPKYKGEQPPTYQTDSLKKDINWIRDVYSIVVYL